MDDGQIQEAIDVAKVVVEMKANLEAAHYSVDKWMEELNAMVEHIKRQSA